MNACLQVSFWISVVLALIITVWMGVPTEQTLTAKFPNVVILRGFGDGGLEPISFDNNTLPPITAEEASKFNGFFQFDPLFYHKTLENFIPWEDRGKVTVFACAFGCSAHNLTGDQVKLALIHTSPDEKKHLWYLLEMRNDDANSPIIYARSKFRKFETYRSPWMTVTPGGTHKPRDLPGVHIITCWDAFRFDTPLKWGVTVALIAVTVVYFKFLRDDDDD